MAYDGTASENEVDSERPILPLVGDSVELQQAIGRVAWASAELEQSIRFLFYQLLSNDSAFAVADGETADWLVRKCLRLLNVEHLQGTGTRRSHAQTRPALQKAATLFSSRNAVVHATWGQTEAGRYVATRTQRFKLVPETTYDLSDLHRLADDLLQTRREIQADEVYGI